MDLKSLLAEKQVLLYQQHIDGCLLEVKETAQYRWFEYEDLSVQSLMSKTVPEQTVMPVYQSLLLFLLLPNKELNNHPLKVLNLGLGGASIERTLAKFPGFALTSVDASQTIIDMAKNYFQLPEKVDVVCQKAELFIQQTKAIYDVVICDLFIGSKNPGFLFQQDFYRQLAKITCSNAVVMINLKANSDEQLLSVLLKIREHFPYIALMEFENHSNIVIICSSLEIPEKEVLQQRLLHFSAVTFTCLHEVIEQMHYIPNNK